MNASAVETLQDWRNPDHWDESVPFSEERALRQMVYGAIFQWAENQEELSYVSEEELDARVNAFVDTYFAGPM